MAESAPQGAEAARAQRQRDLLEQLGQVLQGELDAMLAGQALQLPDLAARKSALCTELEQLQTEAAAAAAPDLRALLEAVAQANARNGQIVAAMIRNTQGALDILRGAVGGAPTYGPRGEAGRSASRPLGSA